MKTRKFWSLCLILILMVLLVSSCAVHRPPGHRPPRPPHEAPPPPHPDHPRHPGPAEHPGKPRKPKKPKKPKKGEVPPPERPAERGR